MTCAAPRLALLTLTAAVAAPALGQTVVTTDSSFQRAAATITASDFRVKLEALAHDSTRGRETPTPELEKATAWVAARFAAAGLRPAGDAGGFLQHFAMRQVRLDSLTTVTVTYRGRTTTWRLGQDIVFAVGGVPTELRDAPVVLMAGVPSDTLRPFGDVAVRGAVLLHVLAPEQLTGRVLNPLERRADAEGVAAHIVASAIPDEMWAGLQRNSFPQQTLLPGGPPRDSGHRLSAFAVRLESAAELLRAAGEDPATLLTPTTPLVQATPGLRIDIVPHHTVVWEATVANVVGVLEGSDPALRDEAVVFTSHIDHVGVIPGRCRPSRVLPADSICNGADDNASGTVGLIELAEAFAALDPRPARTLVFAAMNAEERGLVGSRFYVAHPVVPLDRTAAVINFDMIARNPPDTVGFVGKDYTSLGAVVDDVLRVHPELRLTAGEHVGMYGASDHYPFAQRGVPALFLFSGEHPDLHTAADNPDRADADQAARIVRLACYVAAVVANAPTRPTWEPSARARVVTR
jgi:hypothetical protein